jgi:hypothetical protein
MISKIGAVNFGAGARTAGVALDEAVLTSIAQRTASTTLRGFDECPTAGRLTTRSL